MPFLPDGSWKSPKTGKVYPADTPINQMDPADQDAEIAERQGELTTPNPTGDGSTQPDEIGALGKGLGTNPSQVTNKAPGASIDVSQADVQRRMLGDLVNQLQQQAATGRGSWGQTLRAATQRAQNTASAVGQSNPNVDYGSALSNIGNAQAGAGQRSAGQAEILRNQSEMDAQSQLGDLLGGMGGTDIEQANAQARARQQVRDTNLALIDEAQKNAQGLKQGISQGISSAFSRGGRVPGKAQVFGDDEANDTVSAKLSPGEIVIPRSITQGADAPERAAEFVRAVQARRGGRNGHFADGGDTGIGSATTGDYGAGNMALTFLLPSVGQAGGYTSLRNRAGAGAASVDNGGLLDSSQFDSTRAAGRQYAQMLQARAAGGGPSLAPQMTTNANDEAIARAANARPGGNAAASAAEQAQLGAGEAAAQRGKEQSAGQAALARRGTTARQQELAMAEAQQQAQWANTMMNLGLGIQNQAALRGMFSGAGQGFAAGAGMGSGSQGFSGYSDPGIAADAAGDRGGPSDISSPEDKAFGGVVGLADGGRVPHDARAEYEEETGDEMPAPRAKPATKESAFARAVRSAAQYAGASVATPMRSSGTAANAGAGSRNPVVVRRSERDFSDEFQLQRARGGLIGHYAEGGGIPDAGSDPRAFFPYTDVPRPAAVGVPVTIEGTPMVAIPSGAGGGAPDTEGAGGGTSRGDYGASGAGGGSELPTRQDRGSMGAEGGPPDNQVPQHEMVRPRAERPAPSSGLPAGVRKADEAAPVPTPVEKPAEATKKPSGGGGIEMPKQVDRADINKMNEEAIATQADLEAQAAHARAVGLAEQQKVAQEYALREKETHDRAKQFTDDAFTRLRAAQDEMNRIDLNVDPGRYWATRSTGQKILGIIGLALGAAGTGPDGINRAAQMMNQAIDRDLEAQKAEYEMRLKKGAQKVSSAQSYYAMAREAGLDDIAATHAAKAAALETAANKTEQTVASIQEPLAKAKGQALIASARGAAADKTDAAKQRTFENQIQKGTLDAHWAEVRKKTGGPSEAERKEVGDVTAAARDALGLIDSIEKTLVKTQSKIPGKTAINQNIGSDAAQLDTDTAQLVAKMKDINKLGQIGPADKKLLEEAIGDPQSVFTLESTKRAKLNRIKQIIVDSVSNQRVARGMQ